MKSQNCFNFHFPEDAKADEHLVVAVVTAQHCFSHVGSFLVSYEF